MSMDWFDRLGRNPWLLPAADLHGTQGGRLLELLYERYRSEQLSLRELADTQSQALFHLAQHAVRHSSHFAARLLEAELTPSTLAESGGLAKFPPLTRRSLMEAGATFFCRVWPAEHGTASEATTSGSTGEPVTVLRTELCHLNWLTYTLREHLWHDRDFSGRFASSRATLAAPSVVANWGMPCSLVLQTGPMSLMPATHPVPDLCHWLADFDPDYLLALPSTLSAIVAELDHSGQRLARLRGVRTFSETVQPRLREEVRRVLGLGIDDIYSSQEAGVMAVQCAEGSYHVSETIMMEIVNAEGHACGVGESGRVLVTDLTNYASPIIRYEIGDYAELGEPCGCGRATQTIRRFLGKERNLVLLPDGSRHWPMLGVERWREAYPVRQFQCVQQSRTSILVRIFAVGRATTRQEAMLTTILQKSLCYPFDIHYEWQETPLARGPGGKFEEFLCRAI